MSAQPASWGTPSDDERRSYATPSDASTPSDALQVDDGGPGHGGTDPVGHGGIDPVSCAPEQGGRSNAKLRSTEDILGDPSLAPLAKLWGQRRQAWSNNELNTRLWEMLLACPRGRGTQELDLHVWCVRGTLTTLCEVVGVSRDRARQLRKAVLAGEAMPLDGGRSQRVRACPQQSHADVGYNW